MPKNILVYLQYITPQHLLTYIMGKLAESENIKLKNKFIHYIINRYHVNLDEALDTNINHYKNFNDFFIRKLKPELRPINTHSNIIVSPADGILAQISKINKNLLLQAKNIYFNLENLLGGDKNLAHLFNDGNFTTIYLAPNNYHRVHMPLEGKLIQTIFVPGKLFSVNQMTTDLIPQLYSRNERHISIFDTPAGKMAVILIGAMIVGSIKVVWSDGPVRSNKIIQEDYQNKNIRLQKGEEMGYFKMGSTVIVLFEKDKTAWDEVFHAGSEVQFGRSLGKIL